MDILISNGKYIPIAPMKPPGAVRDYGFVYTKWLKEGEVILSSEWFCDDNDISFGDEGVLNNTTYVFISGGRRRKRYEVENKIVTNFRTEVRRFWLPIDYV